MKLLTTALLTVALCQGLHAQKPNTTVIATLKGVKAGEWVYYSPMNGTAKDSVKTTENGFAVKWYIPEGEADLYTFRIGKSYENGNFLFTFIQPGAMQITGNGPGFTNAVFSGSPYANDLNDYNSFSKKNRTALQIDTLRKQIVTARNNKQEADVTALQQQLKLKDSLAVLSDKQWIAAHKNSLAVAYPLFFSIRNSVPFAEQERIINALSPAAKNSAPVKKILNSIKVDKLAAIGKPAIEFTQNDTAGKPVSLKDFRGKYLLVDFWASWCVPCRKENPHVVKAFNSYKNKGFTVLGVSFDQPGAKEKWLKAIHDDNLTWTHVSDLKWWNNEVGKRYDIHSIPSNLLISPTGIIIAKNLRGDRLEHVLDSLLGGSGTTAGAFTITGTITGMPANSVLSVWYENEKGEKVKDSAIISNNQFVLKGTTAAPRMASLVTGSGRQQQYLSLFLEPGAIKVQGNAAEWNSITVTGTPLNDEYNAYSNLFAGITRKTAPLNARYNTLNELYIAAKRAGKPEAELEAFKNQMEHLRDSMQPYQYQRQQITLNYFREHPTSYISVSQMRFYTGSAKPDTLQAWYDRMGTTLQQTSYGKELAKEIEKLRGGSPGGRAKGFAVNDINGQPISLAAYKGQYVLLDFWASWCVPCRKGNPHLLSLYSKYKQKGLEIIGVSDDDSNPKAWKEAVEKDKIGVWKHILRGLKHSPDGNFDRSNDISEGYGIHSLPTKILIDPNGTVIGRYGGGGENDAAMDQKLSEIFKS